MLGPPREVVRPRGVDIERDITFLTVKGRDLKLDLYAPQGARGRLPAVIWLHGGGWFRGSRSPCPIAPLATRGYVVVAVDYRHSGVAPFPAQLHDAKAAVPWIRQNAERCHTNPDCIGVWGASAGGTLACLLGLTSGDQAMDGFDGVTGGDTSVK